MISIIGEEQTCECILSNVIIKITKEEKGIKDNYMRLLKIDLGKFIFKIDITKTSAYNRIIDSLLYAHAGIYNAVFDFCNMQFTIKGNTVIQESFTHY